MAKNYTTFIKREAIPRPIDDSPSSTRSALPPRRTIALSKRLGRGYCNQHFWLGFGRPIPSGTRMNLDIFEKSTMEVLEPIRSTALFYPCSGNDLELPLSLFAPVTSDLFC